MLVFSLLQGLRDLEGLGKHLDVLIPNGDFLVLHPLVIISLVLCIILDCIRKSPTIKKQLYPTLPNLEFSKSIFLVGYAGKGVLNEDPTVWLDLARPPLISFIGPALT